MKASVIVGHWMRLALEQFSVSSGGDLLVLLEAFQRVLRRRKTLSVPEFNIAGGTKLLIIQSKADNFSLPLGLEAGLERLAECPEDIKRAEEAISLAAKASFLKYLSDRAADGLLLRETPSTQGLQFNAASRGSNLLQAIQYQAWKRGQWCTYEYRIRRYGPLSSGGLLGRAEWLGGVELDLVSMLAEAMPDEFSAWEASIGYRLDDLKDAIGALRMVQLRQQEDSPTVSICPIPEVLWEGRMEGLRKDFGRTSPSNRMRFLSSVAFRIWSDSATILLSYQNGSISMIFLFRP